MITLSEHGIITLPLSELLQKLDGKELKWLIDSLSCEEEVIKEVGNQIMEGWTTMMSCGFKDIIAKPEPFNAIDQIRREIALKANDITTKVIKELQDALSRSNQKTKELEEKINKLEATFRRQNVP